jgi:hypothetical protein
MTIVAMTFSIFLAAASTGYGAQHHRHGGHRSAASAASATSASDTYTTEEVDRKLNELNDSVDARLDTASQVTAAKFDALEKKSPGWLTTALVSAVFSFIFSYLLQWNSNRRDNKNRKLENSKAFIDEYDKDESMGMALDNLRFPDRLLADEAYRRLVEAGNLFERIAIAWDHDQLDLPYLKEHGLHERAKEFWSRVSDARRAHEAMPGSQRAKDLRDLQTVYWTHFEKLVQQVP